MKKTDIHLKKLIEVNRQIPVILEDKTRVLKEIYKDCDDVIFHPINSKDASLLLLYVSGLTDESKIDTDIVKPLLQTKQRHFDVNAIQSFLTTVSNTKILTTTMEIIDEISEGSAVLLNNLENKAISYRIAKYEKRSIDEPQAELVVTGPREGFIESIGTNLSLVRRRIKTPSLKMISSKTGTYSQTSIFISYIEGIADPDIVEEVKKKVEKIDVDAVQSGAWIEEALEEAWYSPFPQVQSTERPDVVTAGLLEGRIAIFIDGTPFVVIVPVTLFTLLQSPEDYNERFFNGTFVRWIRYSFILVAMLAPSAYVAILTFHQEMIPTTLLLRIAQSREEIPFPAFLEALLMLVIFEVLREAGIRLPKQMGSTVSIVGTLVIGQAAIEAGLVSAPMVMIVAITGISSFLLPQYSVSVAMRWIPFPIMFLSAFLGLVGMMLGVILLVSHLCILRSFGVPYMAPLAPHDSSLLRDVLIRVPLKFMKKRPGIYTSFNMKRRKEEVHK